MINDILAKINKLSQREKIIVGILILVLFSLPFFYTTVPEWNKYFEFISKESENKKQLLKTGEQISRLEKLKIENVDLSKKIDRQKLYLPKSYEIDFLVQDLKKICDDSSISLESFTPSDPEPINILLEKQLQESTTDNISSSSRLKQVLEKLKGQDLPIDLYKYPIEVKISGEFTDILELLKKLERYGRVISIDNIAIAKFETTHKADSRLSRSKSKQQEPEGTLVSTFNLTGYSLPLGNESISPQDLKKNTKTFSYTRKKSTR